MRKNLKKNRGITLIALVITIIVLLILAGITITSLSGDNGIIKRSVEGKDRTIIAEIEEMSNEIKTELNMEEFIEIKDYGENSFFKSVDWNDDNAIQKNELAEAIRRKNKGAIRKGNKVILDDKKYEIIVTKDLDIKVQKYEEPKLNVGEIGISYYMEDKKENEPIEIDLYFDVKREYPFFDEYLREKTIEEIEKTFFNWDNETTEEKIIEDRKRASEQANKIGYLDYKEYLIEKEIDYDKSKKFREEYINIITQGKNIEELREMAIQMVNMTDASSGYFDDILYTSYEDMIEKLIKNNNYYDYNEKISNIDDLVRINNYSTEEEYIKKGIMSKFKLYNDYSMKVKVSNDNEFAICHNPCNCLPGVNEGMYINYLLKDSGEYVFNAIGGMNEIGTMKLSNIIVDTPSNRKVKPIDKNTTIYANNSNIDIVMEGNVPIPKGFSYVEGTKEGGMVIKDIENNEFVWIPVDNYSDFKRVKWDLKYTFGQNELAYRGEADENGENIVFKKAKELGWTSSIYDETEETKQEAREMYESVKVNKGFFIGRYEAGTMKKRSYDNTNEIPAPIVKKNVYPYKNIYWADSNTLVTCDKGGAVEATRKLYPRQANKSVVSNLCYGVQWEAALNFIDPNYITNANEDGTHNCKKDSFVFNGNNKGKYLQFNYRKLNNTGSNDSFMVKNIYDMAGNVREWTMESDAWTRRNTRGRKNII